MRTNRFGFLLSLFAALALILAASLPASAAPVTTPASGPVRDQGTGIVLPMVLGEMQFISVTDFQSPGLGVSYRYRNVAYPYNVDLYIYNKNQAIPEGTDAAIVRQEVEQALNDMRAVAAQGVYKNLNIGKPEKCTYGWVSFICVSATLEANNRALFSVLLLRGDRNNFIKIRATWPAADPQSPSLFDGWAQGLSKLLQP